jgi:hypothetical protein
VLTVEYNVAVDSDELIGTTENLTLQARCRISRRRHNRVLLYIQSIYFRFVIHPVHFILLDLMILINLHPIKFQNMPITVAARSEAWIFSRSIAGIVGSNAAGGKDVYCECCV